MVASTDQRYALEIEDLSAGYDGEDVLQGVSFVLKPGEIACLLGPVVVVKPRY